MSTDGHSIDIFCPNCGVQVEAHVISADQRRPKIPILDPTDGIHSATEYSLARCKRCSQYFLAKQDGQYVDGMYYPNEDPLQLYPQTEPARLEFVPDTIRSRYLEAVQAFNVQLSESCVMWFWACSPSTVPPSSPHTSGFVQQLAQRP